MKSVTSSPIWIIARNPRDRFTQNITFNICVHNFEWKVYFRALLGEPRSSFCNIGHKISEDTDISDMFHLPLYSYLYPKIMPRISVSGLLLYGILCYLAEGLPIILSV